MLVGLFLCKILTWFKSQSHVQACAPALGLPSHPLLWRPLCHTRASFYKQTAARGSVSLVQQRAPRSVRVSALLLTWQSLLEVMRAQALFWLQL